ncbi:hypothetical protein ET475_15500 [Microbacterium protaetiae]|uniref:Uncharacterized protein n=1 Tax=Microbacterium protaetiae TaxID=2509458 RepID=A0A4P6ELZ0_9MICO|nr:hypothetical protein [Microbacterium protaetiae]QAY61247.1 hypothetical protein ET475_15500 [Microbacterium protaetiae]
MKWKSALLVGALLLSASAGLPACSSFAPAPDGIELPEKNIDQWVLPLDQFQTRDLTLDTYAENLLVEPCMEDAGYEWKVPYRDAKAKSPMLTALGLWNFNRSVASTYGYHYSMNPPMENAADWEGFQKMTQSISDAEFDTLRACQSEARKAVPSSDDPVNYIMTVASSAEEAAASDPSVTSSESQWRTCMLPLGIADLPDNPLKMPSQSMNVLYGLDDGSWSISDDEVKTATFDFDCRESSGWRKAYYDAEWNAQVAQLDKYGDDIVRMGKRVAAIDKKIDEVIAEHAPAA